MVACTPAHHASNVLRKKTCICWSFLAAQLHRGRSCGGASHEFAVMHVSHAAWMMANIASKLVHRFCNLQAMPAKVLCILLSRKSLFTGSPGAPVPTASYPKPVVGPSDSAVPGKLFSNANPNPQTIQAKALAVPAPSPSRAAKARAQAIGTSLAPFSGLEHVTVPDKTVAGAAGAAQPASGSLTSNPEAAPAPAPEPAASSAAGVGGALELSAAGVAAGAMALGAGTGAGAAAGMAANAAAGVGLGHGGAPAGAGAAGLGNQALEPASTFGSLPAPVRAPLAQLPASWTVQFYFNLFQLHAGHQLVLHAAAPAACDCKPHSGTATPLGTAVPALPAAGWMAGQLEHNTAACYTCECVQHFGKQHAAILAHDGGATTWDLSIAAKMQCRPYTKLAAC